MNMNPSLRAIGEDVMGFLNEVQMRYPDAISMASGRPDEEYFDLENFPEYMEFYLDSMVKSERKDRVQILRQLGQYNRAKGIVNKLISEYLHKDEQILADPEDIVVTVGSQEGMAITALTLCDREKDIIVTEDPSYVGMTHLSILLGYDIRPVPMSDSGLDLDCLEALVQGRVSPEKRVKLVYVIPDFQNPTGKRMGLGDRQRLLELADEYGFFILEDNAYRSFVYEDEQIPTIKALDKRDRVIHLHSFSKVVCPSLRLGALVAGQRMEGAERLSDLMARVKGYISVNTSGIDQAILGGILLKNDLSLRSYNKAKLISIKRKRDMVLLALARHFRSGRFCWEKNVLWNMPAGGFFITVTVPFPVDKSEAVFCAERYGLIFTPMSFFHLHQKTNNQIRLAFSNLPDAAIDLAISKLALYVQTKTNCSKCDNICHESKSQY